MNRIVLIGNGFDLAHGLKTSYGDFINWYWDEWGKRLRNGKGKLEEDRFSSFKLKNSLGVAAWYLAWSYYVKTNPLRPWTNKEIVDIAKQQQDLCDFTSKSEFFEKICEHLQTKKWVDIENVYYRLLFPPVRSGQSPYSTNPRKLNEELEFIRSLLIKYLKSVQDNCTNKDIVKEDIKRKLFAPIQTKDISISALPEWKKFILERFQLDSEIGWDIVSAWDELLKDYGIKAIKEVKDEIVIFIKSYQEQVAHMGIDSISDDKFPDYFLLPNRILLLNFNYTSIADDYMLNNERFIVNHIHGKLEDPESVIFGYGDEIDERYKALLEKNDNEYLRNIKSIKYLESPNYRDMLRFIESSPYQIYIMGHSCGNSDRTMLNTLFEHRNCVSIKPFYHKWDDGTDNYMEIVQNIARNFTDMKLMRDRVVNKTFCETI